jgi:putative transposase
MDARHSTPPHQYHVHSVVWLYNTVRLHSAIGYVTPADRLAGRQQQIHDERDRKLAVARERRRLRRAEQRKEVLA